MKIKAYKDKILIIFYVIEPLLNETSYDVFIRALYV